MKEETRLFFATLDSAGSFVALESGNIRRTVVARYSLAQKFSVWLQISSIIDYGRYWR